MIGLIAAGTGGHIFAAHALGNYIQKNSSQEILYFTGVRPLDYKLFEKEPHVIHFGSKALKGKNFLGILSSLWENLKVFFQSIKEIKKHKIEVLIGLGGHVCGPVILAGFFCRIPTIIIEQNSVVGLTNKILSFFAKKIFTHFPKTQGFLPFSFIQKKITISGNPIREEFFHLSPKNEWRIIEEEKKTLRILIFAGSLGSEDINEFVKNFLEYYSQKPGEYFLEIRHQCKKPMDEWESQKFPFIHYERFEFFEKIWEQYAWADFIIARAGASSCSELYFVQKPTLFIPYPHHKDRHQFLNAELFASRVSSKVFIHSLHEIQTNSYELFLHILKDVYNEVLHPRTEKEITLKIPQKIIWEEIQKY